jgi:hypothetical protein
MIDSGKYAGIPNARLREQRHLDLVSGFAHLCGQQERRKPRCASNGLCAQILRRHDSELLVSKATIVFQDTTSGGTEKPGVNPFY